MEHFAHITFIATQLGHITTLNKDQVKKLTDLRDKFGIRTNIGPASCIVDTSDDSSPEEQNGSDQLNLTKNEKEKLMDDITKSII